MTHSDMTGRDRDGYPWRQLALACGGLDAVDSLTDDPLPDEPFDRSAVLPPLSHRVDEVLCALDRFCDEELDIEFRTAMRRVLARAAHRRPEWFTGRQTPERLAAAVAWMTMSGNLALGRRRNHWSGEDIWYCFGVSRAADLARGLARHLGMLADQADDWTEAYASDMGTDIVLGDPALLFSGARRHLIDLRTMGIEVAEEVAARREAAGPVHFVGDDCFQIRGRPIPVIGAFKGITVEGRAHVMVAFGDIDQGAEVLAVTIPDARALVESIQYALDAPMVVTAR